MQNIRNVQNLK